MAELTMEEYQSHQKALVTITRNGLKRGMPRTRLFKLGDDYLEKHGLTREQLLQAPQPPAPPELVSPLGARVAGGAIGAGLGLVAAGPGGAVVAPAITAEMGGQLAEQINSVYARILGEPVEERPLIERMAEIPFNILLDAGLSGGGAALGRVVRQARAGAVPRIIPATGERGAKLVEGAREFGVDLPAPVVHPSPTIGRLYEAARGLPGGGSLDDAVQRAAVQLDNAFQRTIEKGGVVPKGKSVVGRELQPKLTTGARVMREKSKESFINFGQYFKAGERIKMNETMVALTGVSEELARTPNIRDMVTPARFAKVAEDISTNRGTLSFEELRLLRSSVGEMIDDAPLNPEFPIGQARNLYRALSQDVENALGTKGQRALSEWGRFNTAHRARAQRMDMLNSIAKDPLAANAFNKAFAGAKDGGELLNVVKKTVGKETFERMRQLKLAEMGLPNPGDRGGAQAYDLGVFTTRWNRLSSEAKDVMVGGQGAMRKNLDELVNMEAAFKQGLKRFRNNSQTAHIGAWQRFLNGEWVRAGMQATAAGAQGAMRVGAQVTGVPLLPPYMTAKLMQSPVFVDWLTKGTKVAASNPNGIGAHLGRLAAIAEAQPALAEPIAAWLANYAQEVQKSYMDQGLLREALPPSLQDPEQLKASI